MNKKGRYFVGLFLLVHRNNTCRQGLHRITFIQLKAKKIKNLSIPDFWRNNGL